MYWYRVKFLFYGVVFDGHISPSFFIQLQNIKILNQIQFFMQLFR